MILSDTMIVHTYFGIGAFAEPTRSIAINGVTINPPAVPPPSSTAPAGGAAPDQATQDALVAQVRQRTGMNAQFAAMCLAQNGWDFETALKNFEEIKGSIPAEAYV
jgi:nuclear RNA export factor